MNPFRTRPYTRQGTRRALCPAAVGVVALMTLAGNALGQAVPGTQLTDDEKTKVKKTLALLEATWDDCGILDNTLNAQFNPNSQNGQGNQVTYEGGGGAKLRDAIAHMRKMLRENRIRKENLGNSYGYTRPAKGTDKDVIVINSNDLKKICKTAPHAGISDVNSAFAKINLAATFANEMTHVYQVFDGTDLKQCDAERDSDESHVKFLEGIVKALENNGSGNPHTTVPQVAADGKAGKCLAECLTAAGVNNAAEIKQVYDKTEAQREDDNDRKIEVFEDNIAANKSWGKAYYGSTWRNPIRFPRRLLPANNGVELDSFDNSLNDQFFVPPGNIVCQSMVFENGQAQLELCVVSCDPGGQILCEFYVDIDDDGLPEQPFVAQVTLPSAGPAVIDLSDVMIYPGLPAPLTLGGVNSGVMFLDTIRGEFFGLELDPVGAPVAPPFLIVADPLFGPGGFWYLNSYWEPTPGDPLFLFSDTPDVMAFGNVNTLPLLIPGGFLPPPPLPPIDPLGTGASGDLVPPGVQELELFVQPIVMSGNPGQPLDMHSVGQGGPNFVGTATPGPDGEAPPIVPAFPITGPDLYLVEDGLGNSTEYFLPNVGTSVDNARNDEDGDLVDDQLELTTQPPRMHYFNGVPSAPPEIKQHLYEMILQDTPEPPLHFLDWSNANRQMDSLDGAIDFLMLPGSFPPLYIQSIEDLNGDLNNEEAASIIRQQPNPDFVVEIIGQIPFAPFPMQQIPLPPGFEPDSFRYQDVDFANGLDVYIPDLSGVQDLCLINDGFGNFVLGPCPPPCLADITTQGAAAGDPGFGVPDGLVTGADINFYVNAWVAGDLLADMTTQGAGPGDPLFGVPDGLVTAADINFYVNLWVAGCP